MDFLSEIILPVFLARCDLVFDDVPPSRIPAVPQGLVHLGILDERTMTWFVLPLCSCRRRKFQKKQLSFERVGNKVRHGPAGTTETVEPDQ